MDVVDKPVGQKTKATLPAKGTTEVLPQPKGATRSGAKVRGSSIENTR